MIAGLLLSCALLSPLTPELINTYQECKGRNEIIIFMSDYVDLFKDYFKKEDLELALRITYCESTGNPKAINVNKDKSKDIGLWQFNDRTWNWLKPKLNIKNSRKDVVTSTFVASWLFYNDGKHHWNASKKCWDIPS